MALTGLLIGWRVRNGVVDAVVAFLLLLLFGFALIWLGIWVGSLMRTVEAVQGFMFTVMFPLTFVANTFVPTEDRKSTRLNSSHANISYAGFCLKKKKYD